MRNVPCLSLALSPLFRALALLWLLFALLPTVQAKDNGLNVSLPNGYATLKVDDLGVQSTGGRVRWSRSWDGQEWKFNPHWESLSQSWKNLTGSQTADTTTSTIAASSGASASTASGGSDNCWVSVDEDWQPAAANAPLLPDRSVPFNRVMSSSSTDYPPAVMVSVDYASLCVGSGASNPVVNLEGIRRLNELYLGKNGRYAYSNRDTLEKRSVQALPPQDTATLTAQLAKGSISLASVANPKGFRWQDRDGDWIDYNTQGQVVAYGDSNNNIVWLARDTGGMVRGVVDAQGRVLLSLHYTGNLLTEVRDYPIAGNALDLPQRSVKYQYDGNNRLTQVTDVLGNTTAYAYDADNHIIQITDPAGHAEQIAYNGSIVKQRTAADGGVTDYAFDFDDANKQFSSKITGPQTDAGRRVEDYTHNRSGKLVRLVTNGRTDAEVRYDTAARMETRTNARGYSTRVTKNEFEQVVQIDQPDGTTVKRTYSALNLRLTEATDEAGVNTDYQYDATGNLLKKTEAAGTPDQRITEYEVNGLGQTVKLTRKGRPEANGTVTPDAVWQIEYDEQGQISKTTDPEGNVRQYVYNRIGNLVSYTDPLSHTTRYETDADGNLIKYTDSLGRVKTYVYDKVGNLTTYTDARGKATQAAYDAMNRKIQTINPLGGVYKLQYNGQGLPIAETDEEGRTSQASFDNFLRPAQQLDPVGNKTEYGYNIPDGTTAGTLGALYEPTEVKYPTFTQRTRFDQRNRPTVQTLLNPNARGTEGLVSSAEYDVRGQVKSETDANGKTRFSRYDALGQLVETTDSLGHKTQALYDARGNLLQITDANGHVNRFEYDRNDHVVKEILPLGQITAYQFDAVGNLSQQTDPNSHNIVYAYDAVNRLVEAQQYQSGSQLVRTTSFTWDDADNLTAWSDTDHTRNQTASAALTYDAANRKTGETVTYPDAYTLSYGYGYSAAGKKTQLTWPDGTAIAYGYSGHGELSSVSIPGEGTVSVNQFKWLMPAKITLPGGTMQEKGYDGLLNLESLKVKSPDQQTVLDLANTYGKVLELKNRSRTDTVNGSGGTTTGTYGYDDETRLTQAVTGTGNGTVSETEDFTLDAVGNRIAHSRVQGAWTYDANNRLIQRGVGIDATFYLYDEAGNLTQKSEPGKLTRYTYDTQNRLIEVKDGDGNHIARYGYDPQDRRIWKEAYSSGGVRRTYYLYADEGLIAEAKLDVLPPLPTETGWGEGINATTPIIATQYGPRPDAEFTTGILFVKTKDSNGQDRFAYFHHDHLDTPIQATDKNGNIVWAANYNVFGQATITTPAATADSPTITSNLRLPGQIEDAETGLHYNFRRYYDPQTGRYITQDPIGLAGGNNQYRYGEADPANVSDPTGECPWCIAFALCMGECVLIDAALNAYNGECNNWGNTLKDCAIGCVAGMGLGWIASKGWKWAKRAWDSMPCAVNSFPADTLVHVKPGEAKVKDASLGKSALKPISDITLGDEVLSFAEWKDKGKSAKMDQRLTYEKVMDVYTSYKAQTIVYLTLDSGQTLATTEGHPFKTTDGWRDAILLKKGGKLLLKGGDGDADAERSATIAEVRTEQRTLPVYNLEVANGHTYFIGENGVLTHNNKKVCLTNSAAKEIADKIGLSRTKQIPKEVEKQTGKTPVYKDSDGNLYSPDTAGHRADNAWKQFDPSGKRTTGVFDNNGNFKPISR